jgi:hypothetical protein
MTPFVLRGRVGVGIADVWSTLVAMSLLLSTILRKRGSQDDDSLVIFEEDLKRIVAGIIEAPSKSIASQVAPPHQVVFKKRGPTVKEILSVVIAAEKGLMIEQAANLCYLTWGLIAIHGMAAVVRY